MACWEKENRRPSNSGGRSAVVRANIKGVFATYKTLKDGTRRTYWYHRETGERLHGEPGSPEFIADFASAENLIRDRLAGTFNGWCGAIRCRSSSPKSSRRAPRRNTGACSPQRKSSSANAARRA